MKVYKFGGASVRDAAGIRNLESIVAQTLQLKEKAGGYDYAHDYAHAYTHAHAQDKLIVVVSAMGKTTNALERVVAFVHSGQIEQALGQLNDIRDFHIDIIKDLFSEGYQFLINKVDGLLENIMSLIRKDNSSMSYDELYDQIVSYGELISTQIVSYTLNRDGYSNSLMPMQQLLITDSTFREAIPDMELSRVAIENYLSTHNDELYIAQGFIGGTNDGRRTTLGREGSDYTAALLANMLSATDVTIWKDVPGILNADPRLISNTQLIERLTYYDAVELSYSGAQVIHPKTIRPLENKHIPLYVKPFMDPSAAGSVICDTAPKINIPVFIWRKNQVLITVRPKDFSFLLEEGLNKLFEVIHHNRLKVSLIQSSAVTISVSVDNSRYLAGAIAELQKDYKVSFNEGLSLLTIRNTTSQINAEQSKNRVVLLSQTTRHTAKFLVQD